MTATTIAATPWWSRWTAATAPAGRLATVRILTVAYALVWIVVRLDYWRDLARLDAAQWKPVGFAALIGRLGVVPVTVLAVAVFVVGVVALTGRRWSITGPLFAIGFLVLTTWGASWGAILHTEQLVAIHLLILSVAPDGGRPVASRSGADDSKWGPTPAWPLTVMTAATVTTYFVSGVAKLRFGGGLGWLGGDRLGRIVAYDNARKLLLGDTHAPFAEYVVGHDWLFRVAAVATFVVELGAPLVLFVGALRRWWIVAAWTFHLTVLLMMAILFPYPLVGIAFASMLPAERLSATFTRHPPSRRSSGVNRGGVRRRRGGPRRRRLGW